MTDTSFLIILFLTLGLYFFVSLFHLVSLVQSYWTRKHISFHRAIKHVKSDLYGAQRAPGILYYITTERKKMLFFFPTSVVAVICHF